MALKFDLSTMHMGSEFHRPLESGDFRTLCASSECHLWTIKLINKKQSVDLWTLLCNVLRKFLHRVMFMNAPALNFGNIKAFAESSESTAAPHSGPQSTKFKSVFSILFNLISVIHLVWHSPLFGNKACAKTLPFSSKLLLHTRMYSFFTTRIMIH